MTRARTHLVLIAVLPMLLSACQEKLLSLETGLAPPDATAIRTPGETTGAVIDPMEKEPTIARPAVVEPVNVEVTSETLNAPKGKEAAPTVVRPQGELRMFVFTDDKGGKRKKSRDGYVIRFQVFPDYAESTK